MRELLNDLRNDAAESSKSGGVIMSKIMLGAICLIMCIMNIATNEISSAIIPGCISALCVVNIFMYAKFHSLNLTSIVTIIGIGAMLMGALVTGGNQGFSIVWLLLVPSLGIFFYKLLYGGIFSIALGIMIAIYFWTPLHELGFDYPETYVMRFPLVYFFATAINIYINYKLLLYRKKQIALLEMAQQASNTKSDFLANMSHEIRTPLNAVVGMCELILRENDISDTVRDYCFNIQNSGRSLLSIINDILDFSKIESGRMELIYDEFNISSTINDVINMAVTRKGDKPLELIVRCDPDIPSGLIGDELRIRQVMINLVTNAIKFTNEGCVVIRISQTKHDYGINLSVSVTDTGIGISPENLEKLFSSFSQVDTKKNRSVEGTGLGLAISRKFITSMGGFINVSSVYGSGSEFKFVIPLKVSDPKPVMAIKEPEKIEAACFIDMSKFSVPRVAEEYDILISELAESLHARLDLFAAFDELRESVSKKKFTHIFVGRQEYVENRQFFINAAENAEVVIVQDRINGIDIPSELKCIYKPFYSLTITSLLNNEHILSDINDRRNTDIRFIAPKARVLIVDDNIINLKVAVGLMRPYHMQVVTAESGRAAISLLRSKDIDIVFMDHMMPEMDGVETTKVIRSMDDPYYQKLPIIALTANAVNGVKDMYMEAGLNDFIAKPIELSALARVLKAWLPKELIKVPTGDERALPDNTAAAPKHSVKTELFNSDTGIFYTGGDAEAYHDILEVYLRKAPEKHDYIMKLFEEKSWKNYIIEVHALKSSSLSIGSKPLSELAKELELAGKAGDHKLIEEKNDMMLKMYTEVVQIGKEYLDAVKAAEGDTAAQDNEPAATTEISLEQAVRFIDRIKEACESFDTDEILTICDEAAEYSVGDIPLKALLDEVRSAADDFEYDIAAQKADEAEDKLRKAP